MSDVEIEKKAISITNRNEFSKFLKLLHKDLVHNKEEWENCDLESFLEALVSYSEDIDGYYANMNIDVNPNIPSWRVFADMLCGAKVYE